MTSLYPHSILIIFICPSNELDFYFTICLDDALRDKYGRNIVPFQVIYGFPCPNVHDDTQTSGDSSRYPESELKWIDVTRNAILSSSENLMLSLENHSASILLKNDQLKEQHHRQETFIVAEFLNTKVKMIFDVLTPRRININIHVSTAMPGENPKHSTP